MTKIIIRFVSLFLPRCRALLFSLKSKEFGLESMRVPISYTRPLLTNKLYILFNIMAVVARTELIAKPPSGETFAIHLEAFRLRALTIHSERG